MKFSLGQITDRTENGMYSLVVFAFFSFLITSIYDALEVIFLTGNQKWDDGVGNYISIAELIIFVAVCILAFHRRNDSTIEWLKPHLKRAWRMCLVALSIFIILIVLIIVVGAKNNVDFESAEYTKFVDDVYELSVFLFAIIFVPWSILALLKLKDDKILAPTVLNSNDHANNQKEKIQDLEESETWSDLLKFLFYLIITIGAFSRLYKRGTFHQVADWLTSWLP